MINADINTAVMMFAYLGLATTCLLGLVGFLRPERALNMLRLRTHTEAPDAISEGRATLGGFFVILGLAGFLLATVEVFAVIGLAWFGTALGRMISGVLDRSLTRFNLMALCFDFLLGIALTAPLIAQTLGAA